MRSPFFLWTVVLAHSPAPALLARGDGTFELPLRLNAEAAMRASGDFNGDGAQDLAALVGSGGAGILVFLQDPRDRESWRRIGPISTGRPGLQLRAVDLDRDGDDDLVAAGGAESPAHILLSEGDGTFKQGDVLSEGLPAYGVATGDWNGDRNPDIASANFDKETVSVYLGTGTGAATFLRAYRLGGWVWAVEGLDYDGDGKQDLIASGPGLVPMKGEGDGAFRIRPPQPAQGFCGSFPVTGDFNQDGRTDLVTCGGIQISVGNGTFAPSLEFGPPLPGGSVYSSAAAGDLNGDGALDVALGVYVSSSHVITVHAGRGDGQFLAPVTLAPLGGSSETSLSRDLDRDGKDDFVHGDSIFWGKAGERVLETGLPLVGLPLAGALAVADLDRDGLPDLLFAGSSPAEVEVRLAPGKPPRDVPRQLISSSYRYTSLEAVDLNGDEVPDLAGTDKTNGLAIVSILEADGRIRIEDGMSACRYAFTVAVGSVNGDGAPDLIVACLAASELAVFLGLGGGAFQDPRQVPTIANPSHVAIDDLDRDGQEDLAVVSGRAMAIHQGLGGGEFSPPVMLVDDADIFHSDLAIEDIDGDASPDLVVSETRTRSVLLHPGTGRGGFGAPQALKLNHAPSSLVVDDLDGDGLLDITTSSKAGQSASVLLNRGKQGFEPAVDYPLGFQPIDHRLADFDQDGALDLAALSSAGTAALILFGRPLPPTGRFLRGDVDANGRVQVTDPIALIGRLFLGEAPLSCEDAADADDDGKLNVTDAVVLLGRLFLGGEPLPAPGPERCGEDPTADTLAECHAGC